MGALNPRHVDLFREIVRHGSMTRAAVRAMRDVRDAGKERGNHRPSPARGGIGGLPRSPGGPFWVKKDLGAWSIPKGEIADEENPLAAALREFAEETGQTISGDFLALTPVKQPSRKIVHAFAVAGEVDADRIASNEFELEWPPRSAGCSAFPKSIAAPGSLSRRRGSACMPGWFRYSTSWRACWGIAPKASCARVGRAMQSRGRRKDDENLLTALLMVSTLPAAGQQYFMSITNQSCGPVKLSLLGDVPCDAISTGCRFTLGKNQATNIDLSIVQPTDWMALRIRGSCSDDDPPSTMRGTCALPVGRMFIDQGVDASATVLPPGFVERFPDDDDIAMAGDAIQLPPPQTDLTQFRLLLSDCETVDGSTAARCKVFCDFPPPQAP